MQANVETQNDVSDDCDELLSHLLATIEPWFKGNDVGESVFYGGCQSKAAGEANTTLDPVLEPLWTGVGWQESAYGVKIGPATSRLTVHRFTARSDVDAVFNRFDELYHRGSTARPAPNVAVFDSWELSPNQRALFTGGWGSSGTLMTQQGNLLFVFSENACCWSDNPRPAFPELRVRWAYLEGRWDAEVPREILTPPQVPPSVAQAAEFEVGQRCMHWGELVCAEEAFEAAYRLVPDLDSEIVLLRFYGLLGDSWQKYGDLDAAKRVYVRASQVASTWGVAPYVSQLEPYATVDLFDPFTGFYSLRGCEPHFAMLEQPCPTWRDGVTEQVLGADGNSPVLLLWDHPPTSLGFAVAADIVSVAPTAAIGLLVGNTSGSDGYAFMLDPLREVWWVDKRSPDGDTEALIALTRLPISARDPIRRIEVRFTSGSPVLMVNDQLASKIEALDGLPIRRDGNTGLIVERSQAAPVGAVSATIDSFGIYGLIGSIPRELQLSDELPLPRELGQTWRLAEEGSRSKEEILPTFPDPEEAAREFSDWGWRENAFRDYLDPETGTTISISVHEFRDPEAAFDAVEYLADSRRDALGLEDIDDGEGWILRMIEGEAGEKHELTMFLTDGPRVIRITVSSDDEEQLGVASGIARKMAAAAGAFGQ
ncbi:MAG: hypothetical protein QM692_09545 [Thermomicrobiales bacterium]